MQVDKFRKLDTELKPFEYQKLVNGDVLRQFKKLPVNEEGIIIEYDTIVKSGFFDQGAL